MKPPSIFNLLKKILNNKPSNSKHVENLISSGVKIVDVNSVYIEESVEISPGSIILPSTFIMGNTNIKTDCVIGPNTTISNSNIAKGTKIIYSIVTDSSIGENNQIGPFAYIRESTSTLSNVEIGNFVDVKSSQIGKNSKSKHLAYIGDTEVSHNVNIGAGAVVTKDVCAHSVVTGNPAVRTAWVSTAGEILGDNLICSSTGEAFYESKGKLYKK